MSDHPSRTNKHVRFSDEDDEIIAYDDVPGHRGADDLTEEVEYEYQDDDDYENEYDGDVDLETADAVDEVIDAINGVQQTLVTSEGVAIADVLADIASSLKLISRALVKAQLPKSSAK